MTEFPKPYPKDTLAVESTTSSGPSPSSEPTEAATASMPVAACSTPLGDPVLPEVYWIRAGCPAAQSASSAAASGA